MPNTLKADDLNSFRELLLKLQARLKGDLTQLTEEALGSGQGENSGNLSNVPLHPADAATDNFDQEFDLSMIQNEQGTLAMIDDALGRLDAGTFGKCLDCGNSIPKPRLQALPYTPHCIECARALESRG